jgi:hypothetical protein
VAARSASALRHEIAADVGPRLEQVQTKLETLDAEINVALATWLAELSRVHLQVPPPLGGHRDDPQRAR